MGGAQWCASSELINGVAGERAVTTDYDVAIALAVSAGIDGACRIEAVRLSMTERDAIGAGADVAMVMARQSVTGDGAGRIEATLCAVGDVGTIKTADSWACWRRGRGTARVLIDGLGRQGTVAARAGITIGGADPARIGIGDRVERSRLSIGDTNAIKGACGRRDTMEMHASSERACGLHAGAGRRTGDLPGAVGRAVDDTGVGATVITRVDQLRP